MLRRLPQTLRRKQRTRSESLARLAVCSFSLVGGIMTATFRVYSFYDFG